MSRAMAAFSKGLKSAVYATIPRERLIQRGRCVGRKVALTFDDGPDDLTHDYLELLGKLGVRASFFLVGKFCEKRPHLLREYVRRGHQIASHGWSHQHFPKLAWRELQAQLVNTNAILGPQPTPRPWVRPPYGDVDPRVLAQLLASGSTIALWSLDSLDHKIKDPDQLVSRCSPDRVAPGEVILFHEGQRWTLEALPRIVKGLREDGYELVTMAEMLS